MKLLLCALLAAASLSAQTFAAAPALDEVINQAIAQDRMPGAVLLVGHNGQSSTARLTASVRWFLSPRP